MQAFFSYAGLDPLKADLWLDLRVLVTSVKDKEIDSQALQLLRVPDIFPPTHPWACAICASPDHKTYLRREFQVDEVVIAPLPIEPNFNLDAIFLGNQRSPVDTVLDCAGGEMFAQSYSASVVRKNGVVLSMVDPRPTQDMMYGNEKRGLFSRFVTIRPDGKAPRWIAKLMEANSVHGRVGNVVDTAHGAELLIEGAAVTGRGRREAVTVVRVNQPQ